MIKRKNNDLNPVIRASARAGRSAQARWDHLVHKNWVLDRKVGDLMQDLYYDLKCGYGAAEYNLEEAGMIEIIFGHVAGKLRNGDNAWTDGRWTLTKRGRRTSMSKLKRIILCNPPLEIAMSDAELEADDVAIICGGCGPGDELLLLHERILDHLRMRAERIEATEKRRES